MLALYISVHLKILSKLKSQFINGKPIKIMMIANVHKKVWYPHLNLSSSLLLDGDTDPLLKDPENGCRICSHIEKFRSENSSLLGFHLWLNIFYVSPSRKLFPSLYLSIFEHNLEKQIAKKFCWD